jgi:hypothetical protein
MMLEFRTQYEVDLDSALSELSCSQDLSSERQRFLRREINRLQIEIHKIRNMPEIKAGIELIDLTLEVPVETPPAKKRSRQHMWTQECVDSDESESTCPWSEESAHIHSATMTSFENGFSFSEEVCRECKSKLVTEVSSKGKMFTTCPYSALRDKKGVKMRDLKGKVVYDPKHTFFWTNRK